MIAHEGKNYLSHAEVSELVLPIQPGPLKNILMTTLSFFSELIDGAAFYPEEKVSLAIKTYEKREANRVAHLESGTVKNTVEFQQDAFIAGFFPLVLLDENKPYLEVGLHIRPTDTDGEWSKLASMANIPVYPPYTLARNTAANATAEQYDTMLKMALHYRILTDAYTRVQQMLAKGSVLHDCNYSSFHEILPPTHIEKDFVLGTPHYAELETKVRSLISMIRSTVIELFDRSGFLKALNTHNDKLQSEGCPRLEHKVVIATDPYVARYLRMIPEYLDSMEVIEVMGPWIHAKIVISLSVYGPFDKDHLSPFTPGYLAALPSEIKDNSFNPQYNLVVNHAIYGVINIK